MNDRTEPPEMDAYEDAGAAIDRLQAAIVASHYWKAPLDAIGYRQCGAAIDMLRAELADLDDALSQVRVWRAWNTGAHTADWARLDTMLAAARAERTPQR